jgi:hypothetical protein
MNGDGGMSKLAVGHALRLPRRRPEAEAGAMER